MNIWVDLNVFRTLSLCLSGCLLKLNVSLMQVLNSFMELLNDLIRQLVRADGDTELIGGSREHGTQ